MDAGNGCRRRYTAQDKNKINGGWHVVYLGNVQVDRFPHKEKEVESGCDIQVLQQQTATGREGGRMEEGIKTYPETGNKGGAGELE